MEKPKRIGILTSGGDCPGLNAVLHAVLKYATSLGWQVYGIPNGTDGFIDVAKNLCQPEDLRIDEHSFDIPGQKGMGVLLFLSGSVIGCRGKKKRFPEEDDLILKGYNEMGLDALIAIGGDGSLEIIYELAVRGRWNLVAVPKTIDNDVPGTERVVGFDTAVAVVSSTLYNLTFTAASHDRVMLVEVMGRDAGHLALEAGIAGSADVILIPELVGAINERVIRETCLKIAQIRETKRKFALIVVAEGVKKRLEEQTKDSSSEPIGEYFKRQLQAYSRQHCTPEQSDFCGLSDEVDMRVIVLGHLPRSSPPSSSDRLLAVAFGIKAVDLIARGSENLQQMVVWEKGEVHSQPLQEVMARLKQAKQKSPCAAPVDPKGFRVHAARALGIYLGEEKLA